MNIVVCVKQVPATTEKFRIDPQTNTLVRLGTVGILDPFDACALEEGVRMKEKHGGKVTAVSMGLPQVVDMLREAVSVGADHAVLLSDPDFAASDTLATSYVLSQAIRKVAEYDLVICGRQALDGGTGHVAPQLSHMLGLPFVAYVSKIEDVAGGSMRVQRAIEGGHETIEVSLPAVISVTREINTPRLPALRSIIKAKSAQIPVWAAADVGADRTAIGRAGSATGVVKTWAPQRSRHSQVLEGTVEVQIETLITKLRETKTI